MPKIVRVVVCLLAITAAASTAAQDLRLEEWVQIQLTKEKPERVTILEQKLWPHAPQANTYVIVAVGIRKPDTPNPICTSCPQEFRDFVVLLVQSSTSRELANPKLLSYFSFRSGILLGTGVPRISIDFGPYQIREREYAFGIRSVDDELVGNKGGLAFEYIRLFRYQSAELKEIFDEVRWGYSKYSEPGFRSCNTETMIVSEPSPQGEFFTLTRKHSRSYLGDSRMYGPKSSDEMPIESCPDFDRLRFPNIHTWDTTQGRYVDPEFSLRRQDPGKAGSPYRKNR
jgi:hypothetical protein